MWIALLLSLLPQDLPEVVVTQDDTVIQKSCRIRIEPGTVIADVNQNGVIQIQGDDLTVVFTHGSGLRGAHHGVALDQLQGIGIRINGSKRLTLRGARVSGYRCGIWATEANHLRVEGAYLSRNYAQKLRSTPQAEDTADWLWPHDNDKHQWRTNYGAGLYIERSQDVLIHDVTAREQQNGIVLDRVVRSRVFDNDCSFLSGWGLAMWRSTDNIISRNAFDFCIRGYSHGIYNRGQDSAGILLFEQCSRNVFAQNSATHGGDGLFGFAGREALGDAQPMPAGFNTKRAGCNDNFFYGNDFSYAAAHGLELTFSFGNTMFQNKFTGNAICGIWGGFSQDTRIFGNTFEANGERGYGLERGGVNIDRSRNNWVVGNQFHSNKCGIHYWGLATSFEEKPWGMENNLLAHGNVISSNVFQNNDTAVHLRGNVEAAVWNNQFSGEGKTIDADNSLQQVLYPIDHPQVDWPQKEPPMFGKRQPVGARAQLAGRENIIMGVWGPWDHQSPLLRTWERTGSRHLYRVEPATATAQMVAIEPAGIPTQLFEDGGRQFLVVEAPQTGFHQYLCTLKVGEQELRVAGEFLSTEWEVRMFATPQDPREQPEAWLKQAFSDDAWVVKLDHLHLAYGGGGPKDLKLDAATAVPANLGSDYFGTRAQTTLQLPAGEWQITMLSDDGIRVLVDGKIVIDNWTWHAPTEDIGSFELKHAQDVEIVVEHFELNGYSVLEFELAPADA
ncbi:MAG: right-handed parallel beta-helix repeat-containing protein [Planctomycetes bacterium]|nr:right-handed parallel beta-helix repeat-containing protein [Planctomycetota bacterium]